MAKTSGTTRGKKSDGGLRVGDEQYKGKVGRVESLSTIKNKKVYDEVMHAISRMHAVLGATQRKVKLADLEDGVGGVHVTRNGKSEGVYLNKSIFQPAEATTQSVASWAETGYRSHHLTETNNPAGHIAAHEYAHALWNEHLSDSKSVTAGKDIKQLYKQWTRDKKKSGYGAYASTNVSEFFAELATRAVHGQRDKYTDKLKEIIRKHRL